MQSGAERGSPEVQVLVVSCIHEGIITNKREIWARILKMIFDLTKILALSGT